jgi:hypothetical protein
MVRTSQSKIDIYVIRKAPTGASLVVRLRKSGAQIRTGAPLLCTWRAHTLDRGSAEIRSAHRPPAAPARSAGSSTGGRDGDRVRRGREALGAPAAGDGATL